MGILKDRCDKLINELRGLEVQMVDLEDKIRNSEPHSTEFEKLYEREFILTMSMSGCFEDLHINLRKLEEEDPGFRFYIKRVREEADKITRSGIIEIGDKL